MSISKNKPENETKEEKSERLMVFRITKTIGRLRQIQTLAKSPRYSYTEEQKQKVLIALQKELDTIESAFNHGKKKEEIVFNL